ncbi:hypothetical protein C0Q70_05913 [Pomacea canaliculata]|uniref:Uncharacterized protein n=1 Tax=Pomacea canaliculata TaxID=400727 RepID=A0A2T7PMI1_POMCA|nr:uncharacterized protein LOC112560012 [Pomacea canaliculata]PVD34636.1 hypothetical protein C0Q70_05913 [Pomacea canaliculata]
MSTSRFLAAVGLPVLVSLLLTEVNCACDPSGGPAGNVGCIRSSLYNNQYQYATCHTNSYILQKSKGVHFCLSGAYYCYYQCMLEVYDKESGAVSSDCQCTSTSTPSPTLSSECYSPSGTDCGWYLTCLERKLGCSGGLDSYVMAFSQKLCALAEGKDTGVTETGLKWLNATRRCIQVELAPLLLPYESFTCSDVSAHAYEKQAGCYSKPYQSDYGICRCRLLTFGRFSGGPGTSWV